MMAKIVSNPVLEALRQAGIADENTRRVVIDIGVNMVPVVYIERYCDERLLEVVQAVSQVEIKTVPADAAEPIGGGAR